uniref:Uncharacterized protein n=1 Tax=Psychrobacter sp. (strain PRwf-1) TaxID=349106 RepID=A5WEB0_PSYWF
MIGETTTDTDGNYEVEVPVIADGDKVEITATDKAGNESDPVEAMGDTTAPDAPTATVSPDGTTVTGKTEPGATVEIKDKAGNVIGTATADDKGEYTAELDVPLTNGETITAEATDKAGNGPSTAVNATAPDTTAPDAPTATVSPDGTTVTGKTEPGATVEIKDKAGNVIGTATADDKGEYTAELDVPLTNGETITAEATDKAGNGPSTAVNATAPDTTAPDAPTTAPDMTAATDTGTSDTDNLTSDTTPDFTVATPTDGTPVLIVDGVEVPATVKDNGDGTSTLTPTKPLTEGEHTVAVATKDPAGNVSDPSAALPVTIDTKPPVAPTTAPDMTAATDTGTSDTDNLTSDTTPDFTVATPTDGTPVLIVDGVEVPATVKDNGDGTSTLTPTKPLTEGEHTVAVATKDPAGNVSDPSAALPVTIDTKPPVAPTTAPDMTAATDTGTSDTDNLTSDTTPDFTVATPTDGTPVLIVDGVEVPATVKDNGDGTSTLTPTKPLTEGEHTVAVATKDPAGNVSDPSAALPVTIDTKPPVAPTTAPDMTAATDTGTSDTDNLTSDTTPDFTVATPTDGTPVLIVDGVEVPATVKDNGDGTSTLTPTKPLTEGEHTVAVATKDPAGNVSDPSAALPVTIDTKPPVAPTTAPDMTAATDTGTSDTDNLTSDTTPDFTVATPTDGTPVLIVDGVEVPATVKDNGDGTSTLTPTKPLTEGEHTVAVATKDPAGNVSDPSAALPVTIDTKPPVAPTTAPDMTAATDTGTSDTDNLTSDTTPDFTVATPTDGTPVLIVDGVEVPATVKDNGDGTSTLTPTKPLTEGEHTVAVATKDPAGNVSDPSAALPVTIDTKPPVAPTTAPDMTAATDTGTSDTDNLTSDTTPDFTVATPTDGTPVLIVDGVEVPATVKDNGDGTSTLTPTKPLTEGEHTVAVATKDPAGNVSDPSAALPVTIDTKPPVAPTTAPDMTAATDTGTSDTDNLTSDTTPDFTVATPTDGTPVLIVDGVEVPATVKDNGDGTSTLTPTKPLTEGEHTVAVATKDPAGNVSDPSAALPVTIDTKPPVAPTTAPDMTAATDTGTSDTDNLTSDTTPDFTVATPTDGTPVLIVDGVEVPATVKDNGDGTSTLTPTKPLTEGEHTVAVATKDPAGNVSDPSAALPVTIDTKPPVAPTTAPDMTAATDTGTSDTDNLTSDTTPDFTVATPTDGTPVLIVDGVEVPATVKDNGDGTSTLTPTKPLTEGEHTVAVATKDPAGNVSDPSAALPVTIDTKPPVAPTTAPDMTAATDTGTSDTDNLTSDTTPDFTVATPTDGTPVLIVDGVEVPATVKDNGDGTSTLTPTKPLTEGEHTVAVATKDPAGNVSDPSAALPVTIDTKPPVAPTTAPDMTAATDTGTSDTDNLTSDTTPDFTVATPTDGTPVLIVDGVEVPATVKDNGDGTSTLTPTKPLTEGEHTVAVATKDPAGNVSDPSAALPVTIDTKPPVAPTTAPDMTAATDTGTSDTDNLTSDTTPDFTVATPTDGTPVLIVDGVEVPATVKDNGDGTSTLTPTKPLTEGEHTVAVATKDPAGNVSDPSAALPVTIDTKPPVAPTTAPDMTAATDTGTSDTDNLTSDNTPDFTVATPTDGTPVLIVDGVEVPATVKDNGDGTSTLTPTKPLTEGEHTVAVATKDPAGNVSDPSAALPVTIDTKPPVAPTTAPDMTAATDTGTSDTDNLTSDTTPDFTVATPTDGTPVLIVDGVEVPATVKDNGDGTSTLTPTKPLTEGEHTVAVATKDPAGNVSDPSAALPVTIDTKPPVAPTTAPDMTAATDTGTSDTDNLTSDTTPDFTVATPTDGTPVLIVDGVEVPATVKDNGDGTSTLTPTKPLTEGEHTVAVATKDPAGNVSDPSAALPVTIDTKPPVAPTTAPDMTAATDTGTSDTDNLTSDTTPDFTVATPTDGTPVLIVDGVEVPATVKDNGDGTSTLTPTKPLTEGEHTVAVATKDPAGNVSDPSAALPVTIDTKPPVAPTTAPDMTAATDTGTSDTDNLTSDTTPDFTVATPTDGTPVLIVDGVEVPATVKDNGDGTSTLTPTKPLTEGEHTVAVATKDPAGNVSDPSAALPVTIDTKPPVAPTTAPDMTAATDTGTSDTDNLTSDTTPDFTVATPTDGTPVLIVDGVEVPATVKDNGDGTSTLTPTKPLTEGEHTVAVATKDPAGNVSDPSAALPVTIDTKPPVAPTTAPDMTAATDTGTSDTDNLTSDTTPDFTVATPTDGTPVLIVDGVEVPATVKDNGDGTSTLTPTKPLTEGEHTVAVATKDPAGNVSDPSAALPVTIDTKPPVAPTTAPDMTAATDTGTSDTDNLTSDTTPDFTVATPTDGTPVLIVDGVEVPATVKDNGDGTSTLTPTKPLTEGEHTVAVATKDPAGNVSDPSAALPVTIDTKPPVAPTTAPDMTAATDTGTSDTDNLTSDTTPDFTVATPTDGTPVLIVDGVEVPATVKDNGDGTSTLTPTKPLTEGEHTVAVATKDPAGNVSDPSAALPVTIDTKPPVAPTTAPDMTAATDTGTSDTDNLTSDTTPDFTVATPTDGTPVLIVDGVEVPATVKDNGDGTSTLTPTKPLTEGEHTVAVATKDPAGNVSDPSAALPVTIDTKPPVAPTTAPDMTAATDTGTSDTDNLTSDTTPDFTVATPTDGTPVLIVDGVEVPATVKDNGDGTSTLTPTKPLTEGEHTVAVATKDPAGNVSDPSAALPVTIDTKPPVAPTTAPDMTAATDTGTSDTDNLTSDTTPDFTVATPTDGTPVLIVDGVEVPATVKDNGDGTSTLTPTKPLTEGEHTVAVATKDPAGNVSDPSAALPVTIDTKPPVAPTTAPDMTAATDTGTSDTDNLTSDTTPDFTVATPTDGTPVLIVDGVEVPATVKDNGDGTSTLTPTKPLTEGEHTVAVATKDPAGNVSDPSAALPVTIDTKPPVAPTTAPDMTAATDTGTSDTDNLTSDTTPDFTVATPTDGTPVLIVDGVEVPATVKDNGDGTSTLTPTKPLTEGEHTVAVATKDPAGNVSDPSAALPVTIDTKPPVAPTTAPDMTAATDTGTSDTDNLTSDTTPDFTVATPTDGTPVLIVDGVEVPATVKDNGDGTSTLTPTKPLTEGEHTVAVATKDPAGNVSDPSAALPVTIDTKPPVAPTTAPDMTAATDTGTSDTDNLTSDTTPDFTVATPTDGTPVLIVDGVEVPATVKDNGDGTSTLTPTKPLTEGEHTVAVATKDPAGNVSDPSAALPVTIDTKPPVAPTTAPDMTAATDTGTSDTDNLTSDTTPDFTVATPTDGTPVLIVDGVEVPATVKDNGDGTSTLTPTKPLTEGEHTVAVATKDPAGNVSDPSAALPVTIDTKPPVAPTTAPDMTAATDTGTSDTDNLTSDTTPDFTVATPTDGTPVLIVDGVEVPATVKDNGDGTSTLTPTKPLTEGEHTVAVATKDPAGNVSDPSAALPVTIDTKPPVAPTTAPDMTAATDTGTSDTDNLTSDTTPDFTVATPTDGTPVLIVDGVEVPATVKDNGDGTSTLTPTKPLTEGEHTVAVATKDPAGNVSDPSAALPVTIDTKPPVAPTTAPDMTAATDTGTSDTDNLTSDTTPDFTVATPTDGTPVLIVDGVEVPATVKDNGDGTSTLTPTKPLTEGEHTVAVATKDPAGNVSDPSAALPVTIDTKPPVAPTTAPDMTAATDTGTSDTDNLTSDNTPDFTVATPTDGTPVLIVDGVEVPATVKDNGDGTSTLTPTKPLTEGEHTVAVATKDPAGNVSDPSAALPVTIDTKPPVAPTTAPDMTAATDTGTSDTDNLTSDTTPDFTVATPTDGTPVLIVDGVEVPATVKDNGDGTSTLTPTKPLTEGEHTVAVATKDPAGNVSDPSAALPVTIDTKPPVAPTTAPDMTAATDTGTSHTDNLTSDTTPDFTVATPTDGTPVLIVDGVEVPATVKDNGDGTSTLTPTKPLTEGEHTVAVATKDPAGNVSDPSAALPVTIDTKPPVAPTTAPDMTAATDTGTSHTDNLTSDTTPDFTVATPTDGTPVLIVDGVEVPATVKDNGDGTSTLTPTKPLTEGEHTVAVATKDPAGNVSDPSAALPVTIDTKPPVAPTTAPDMTAATDTGTSDTDNLTSDTTPDFTVATPTDGTPVLIVDGVEVPATVKDNGDGTSTLTPTKPLTEGEHTVAVATKDPAGNVSDPSAALPVTIDTKPPVAPTTAPDMTAATDTGISDTDNLTSDTTPDFTVATPTDGTPVLIVDGVEVPATVKDNGDGTSTLTPTKPLTEGEHTVAVATKDPAGNVSDPSAALPVTIDTKPPVSAATVALTADTNNDGLLSTAELNGATTTPVEISIPSDAQVGDVITVTDNAGTTIAIYTVSDGTDGTVTAGSTQTATANVPADGSTLTVTSTITDAAGNTGPNSTDSAKVDTSVTTGTLSFANLTDSGVQGDNKSNDNTFDLTLADQEAGSDVC